MSKWADLRNRASNLITWYTSPKLEASTVLTLLDELDDAEHDRRRLRITLGRAVTILKEWRSTAWPDEPGFVFPVDRMSHTDLFLEFDVPAALHAAASAADESDA